MELLVPVDDPAAKQKLLGILKIHLHDNVKARKLLANGTYERVKAGPKSNLVRSQEALYQRVADDWRESQSMSSLTFEPHRAPGQEE